MRSKHVCEERKVIIIRQLTKKQKNVLGVLTDKYQEIGDIMVATGDCYVDRVLLQLSNRGLAERGDMHREGKKRTWLGYKISDVGKEFKNSMQ